MKRGVFILLSLLLLSATTFAAESKICTMEYNPQCWKDGVTYANPCMAWTAAIEKAGECESKSKGQSCSREYKPVCWVDWNTYGSSCHAWKVEIAHIWPCLAENGPKACTNENSPVCWMDGKTYTNLCMAWNVEVSYNWECMAKTGSGICTREYNPQCWVNWTTYANLCMAWKTKIAYAWECTNKTKKSCTREYNPVCWVDGKTYSNLCMAGENEIAYIWQCDKVKNLSANNKSFLEFIKSSLEENYAKVVDKSLANYKIKTMKFKEARKELIKTLFVDELERRVNTILVQYPQDKPLPKNANTLYLVYKAVSLAVQEK